MTEFISISPPKSNDDNYIANAHLWHQSHWERVHRSERRAWLVALLACLLLSLSVAAWVVAIPFKKTEPFLVRVDSSSGRVDVVPIYNSTEPLPEAVTRLLVTEYVEARERYISQLAETDYQRVGAFQGANLNADWQSAWARSNPNSPLNRYADGTSVTVDINSVTFLKSAPPYQIQVRFKQHHRQTRDDTSASAEGYVVTLSGEYQNVAQDPTVRALNPLGFKVLEYRKEPEIVLNINSHLSTHHE